MAQIDPIDPVEEEMVVVNINIATGKVVDKGQYYDEQRFINKLVPKSSVPEDHLETLKLVYDANDDSLKVPPIAVRAESEILAMIKDDIIGNIQGYHSHNHNQLVLVLYGSTSVNVENDKATNMDAMNSYLIVAGVSHFVKCESDTAVVLNIHLSNR